MSEIEFFTDEDERDRVQARAAADVLIGIVERHEADDHDGALCPDQRAGIVAFVAHCLGLRPGALRDVERFLVDYEETHEHHHTKGGGFDD